MNVKSLNLYFLYLLIVVNICSYKNIYSTTQNINTPSKNGCNTASKNNPFAAAVFIDEEEFDIDYRYSITSNLAALFYLQTSPIIVIGPHLLINLVKHTELLKTKAKSWFKFWITLRDAIIDFDKNWLAFEIRSTTISYLLIPRKHLEYYFNINIGAGSDNLSTNLQNLCKQGKIIDSLGIRCKNIDDIIVACGFQSKGTLKINQIFVKNIFEILEKNTNLILSNDLYITAENIFSDFFQVASDSKKWHIFLNGHGNSNSAGAAINSICGLPEDTFKRSFFNICTKNVSWLTLKSCFLGGPNRCIIENEAKALFDKHQCPKIAIISTTDASSFCFGPNEIWPVEAIDSTNLQNLMLIELPFSATTFGLYGNSISASFFRGENIYASIINASVSYLTKTLEYILIPANWPLILNTDIGFKFVPLEHEKYVKISSVDKNKAHVKIEIDEQQILFVENKIIENINYTKNIIPIISTIPNQSLHLINKIDSPNSAENIEFFLNLFVLHWSLNIGCSSKFLIKELNLGNPYSKYVNILIQRFYNKNNASFVVEVTWKNHSSGQYFASEYFYEKEPRGWIKQSFRTLSNTEIAEYKNDFDKTEQLIKKG